MKRKKEPNNNSDNNNNNTKTIQQGKGIGHMQLLRIKRKLQNLFSKITKKAEAVFYVSIMKLM